VLLWLDFSAQALLLGAEFTRVYAEHFGARLSVTEMHEIELAQTSSLRRNLPGR
jgi:uncharacterized BrkB/YihY/UPF0761 family membrane protein